MEKEEPIIRRVYRKSLNYGATVVSVVSYAFVTVVPPRMSRSFHGHCHTRSMVMERPCPPRWNKCVNTCCHNCSKDSLQFNHLSLRADTKSTIVTTNLAFDRWGEIIKDKVLVTALVDRLTHNAFLVNMNGESYRLKETKKFNEQNR